MGHELYREWLDHAPVDLSVGERLVGAVLADFANDNTREAYPGEEALTRRTGMSPSGRRKALLQLARRGIELRVPIGKDKHGRAVYAAKGHQVSYRMPDRQALKGVTTVAPLPAQRRDGGPTFTDLKGVTKRAQRRDETTLKAGPPSHPSPQEPSGTLITRAREPDLWQIIHDGLTEEWATRLLEMIKQDHPTVRNPKGYVITLAAKGDLGPYLDAIDRARAAQWQADLDRQKAQRLAELTDGQPRCRHGHDGGAVIDPDTGLALCRGCRDDAALAAAGVPLPPIPDPTPVRGNGRADTAAARAAAQRAAQAAAERRAQRRRDGSAMDELRKRTADIPIPIEPQPIEAPPADPPTEGSEDP